MAIDIPDFLQYCVVKQNVGNGSIGVLQTRCVVFNKWLSKNSQPFTNRLFEDFVFYLKKSGRQTNTINTYIFTLRYLNEYLKDRSLATEDCIQGIKNFPKKKPIIIVLTTDEISQLLTVDLQYGLFRGMDCNRLNWIYKSLIELLADTGMRFDEGASLVVRQIDFSAERILLDKTKNGEYRFAYPTKKWLLTAQDIIQKEEKKQSNLLFTSMLGTKIREQEFNPDLKKRAVLAGITKRVHPHLLRHSYATELLSQGVQIETVAKLLGHKDIQTTYDNYAHLADSHLKRETLKHPRIRSQVEPKELLNQCIQQINQFDFQNDQRFDYIKIQESISTLWKSIKTG